MTVVKGGSRAKPLELATHLGRTDTNERVEVLEKHSPYSLHATFRDYQVLCEATQQGEYGLYHASIDPDARYVMTVEQWLRSADILEEELGLNGQPRVIVLHEKKGREHIHVVWQRTDLETMTLRDDGFNYQAHERASLRMEREFGHEHVPGKHAKRDREKQPEFPRAEISHGEWQQAERAALSVEDRRARTAALKESCDSGAAFKAALEAAGYMLAQSDRRDFVLVTAEGSVLSLAREVGMKAAEVRAFMADVDRAALPSAAEAKAAQRARQDRPAQEDTPPAPEQAQPEPQAPPPLAEDPAPEGQERDLAPAVALALAERQAKEAAKLAEWHEAELRQLEYVLKLDDEPKVAGLERQHKAERDRLAREQRAASSGIEGYIEALQNRLQPGRGAEKLAARKHAWRQLRARQAREKTDMEVLLEQNRAEEIEALKERHAQQQREQAARFEAEKKRYAEDAERARRLLEQVEEDRRAAEQTRQQGRGPDGPPERAK